MMQNHPPPPLGNGVVALLKFLSAVWGCRFLLSPSPHLGYWSVLRKLAVTFVVQSLHAKEVQGLMKSLLEQYAVLADLRSCLVEQLMWQSWDWMSRGSGISTSQHLNILLVPLRSVFSGLLISVIFSLWTYKLFTGNTHFCIDTCKECVVCTI